MNTKKKGGRPSSEESKRTKRVAIRLNEKEYAILLNIEDELKINCSKLFRSLVLFGSNKIFVHSRELIYQLDKLGVEFSRVNNNINQIAHCLNSIKTSDKLPDILYNQFLLDFKKHIQVKSEIEKEFRSIIRLLTDR